ncbi:MAG: amylo-alpha-1,6-glucosidase [Planctomycetota bacterium]
MLILQRTKKAKPCHLDTTGSEIGELLNREWLLTNGCGGYSSSTVIGCNTRRYHGLLVGSLNVPVDRIVALSNCLEMVIINGQVFDLSTFEFNDSFAPNGFKYMRQFRRDTGIHFDYQVGSLKLTRSVYLAQGNNTVAIVYDFGNVKGDVELITRPFVNLRDFHELQRSHAPLTQRWCDDGLVIHHDVPESCELYLKCDPSDFEKDQQWWFNFAYRRDKQRGQDFIEDLWSPGFFRCPVDSPGKVVLWANLSSRYDAGILPGLKIDGVRENLIKHQKKIISTLKNQDRSFVNLCLAADAFISRRNNKTTILAGYPWFADWGRDTFISLPGLLLATERFDEAESVLTMFAEVADEGMIPNRFDDRDNTVYFNSIDASLWFVNSAFQYLNVTGNSSVFVQHFLPVIRWIIDSYQKGTRFGIHADADGLITGGDEQTQLTWMDARYGDVTFTPRSGKAVEVNALWYNALCWLTDFYTDRDDKAAEHYRSMANKVTLSFRDLFWNDELEYLNDCILPDGKVDASLRPNQIFAVSLPFSPLLPQQQLSVVDVIQRELLTPFGLRTLKVSDPRYKNRYQGPQAIRDEAYHQGTVWAYLIGSFVEAFLKVNNFSRKSKTRAAEFIKPLMHHLTDQGCFGQVSEIFDGDPPHEPRGCFAQAWSVAELIRAYKLING